MVRDGTDIARVETGIVRARADMARADTDIVGHSACRHS